MALKISRMHDKPARPKVSVNQRLYRTRDGKRLVPEGHADAAFLFCAAGQEVDAEEFESLELDVPGEHQVVGQSVDDRDAGQKTVTVSANVAGEIPVDGIGLGDRLVAVIHDGGSGEKATDITGECRIGKEKIIRYDGSADITRGHLIVTYVPVPAPSARMHETRPR